MGNDDCGHAVLVVEVVIELLQVGLSVALLLYLLAVVVELQRVAAGLQLLQELIPEWRTAYLNSRGRCLGSGPFPPAAVPPVVVFPAVGFPVIPGFPVLPFMIQIINKI